MFVKVEETAYEVREQRALVRSALRALRDQTDLNASFVGLTGELILMPNGQAWVGFVMNFHDSFPQDGFARVFEDMAEFDRITGCPDPVEAYGLRLADCVHSIRAGIAR